MKTARLENKLVASLFVLVLIVFSLAERDSKKLDRLYKTAALLQKKEPTPTVQSSSATTKAIRK